MSGQETGGGGGAHTPTTLAEGVRATGPEHAPAPPEASRFEPTDMFRVAREMADRSEAFEAQEAWNRKLLQRLAPNVGGAGG